MEIALIVGKVYLVIAGISTILIIGKPREPQTGLGAVVGLVALGFFYYLISH